MTLSFIHTYIPYVFVHDIILHVCILADHTMVILALPDIFVYILYLIQSHTIHLDCLRIFLLLKINVAHVDPQLTCEASHVYSTHTDALCKYKPQTYKHTVDPLYTKYLYYNNCPGKRGLWLQDSK